MWNKESLFKKFSDIEVVNIVRYKAMKIIFAFAVFLFFVNFYLLGSNFYFNIFILFLPYTYTFLIISLLFYLLLLIEINIKNNIILYTLVILLLIFFILLLIPFTSRLGFQDIIQNIILYFERIILFLKTKLNI